MSLSLSVNHFVLQLEIAACTIYETSDLWCFKLLRLVLIRISRVYSFRNRIHIRVSNCMISLLIIWITR